MKHCALLLILVATLLGTAILAQVGRRAGAAPALPGSPPLVNYQGRVAVDSVNFEGQGQFKFALVNDNGTVTFWSNDGTSFAGSEPAAAVTLTVAKGLYSVLLGDPVLGNMIAIPVYIFTNPDVRLRVWFDDGVNGSQLLTPDQRLAPVAYLAEGAVTTAAIAPGAVNGTSVAPGSLNGTNMAAGSLDFSHLNVPAAPGPGQVLGFDGNTLNWVAPGGGVWSLNGSSAYYNGGRVGIGTLNPSHHLSIIGGPTWTSNDWGGAISLDNADAIGWQANAGGQRFGMGHSGGGFYMFRTASDPGTTGGPAYYDFAITDQGKVGIGTTKPSSKLEVLTEGGDYGFTHSDGTATVGSFIGGNSFLGTYGGWLGTISDNPLHFFVNDGNPSLTINTTGNVGIGTTLPASKLDIVAQDALRLTGFQPFVTLRDSNASNARSVIQSVAGGLNFFTNSYLSGSNSSAFFSLNNAGNVGIGTATPVANLDVRGSNIVEATVSSTNDRAIVSLNSTIGGANRVWTLENGLFGTAGLFGIYDRTSGRARLTIDSNGTVTVPVLSIIGGADVAEPFPMNEDLIAKGSVVIIDSEHPGHLKRSHNAYDTRVAGIVSGANGISPGIALHQEGAMEGDQNVALSGRVYVQAVTSNGPIEPGDLLTTSNTPGYAMKVTDHNRAQGAVLGKAMTPLKEGQGMVLTLVSLQ